ncbi:hypothetical protein EYF80_004480 [Liparis tanakae]|uniref:Uncharacterized protein n=1 Tax=Liparis tanakae TaxID=230148 RepID=A0A4Z2J4M0_9TELE|nr:hypothetical protein EYF80_004480 [Liparis tanakae]
MKDTVSPRDEQKSMSRWRGSDFKGVRCVSGEAKTAVGYPHCTALPRSSHSTSKAVCGSASAEPVGWPEPTLVAISGLIPSSPLGPVGLEPERNEGKGVRGTEEREKGEGGEETCQ